MSRDDGGKKGRIRGKYGMRSIRGGNQTQILSLSAISTCWEVWMASKGSFLTGGEFAWGFRKLDVVIAASRPRRVSI